MHSKHNCFFSKNVGLALYFNGRAPGETFEVLSLPGMELNGMQNTAH